MPTKDQFATEAEYRDALAAYQKRSKADLEAGNITKGNFKSKMESLKEAKGKLDAGH